LKYGNSGYQYSNKLSKETAKIFAKKARRNPEVAVAV
jgi:hypothetical protein